MKQQDLLNFMLMAAILAAVLSLTACSSTTKQLHIYAPEKCVRAVSGDWVCESEE